LFVTSALQTAGRGRQGRTWHSPVGNLYGTMAWSNWQPLNEVGGFTLYAALRINDVLRTHTGADLWVKWPNDLWIGTRKCAGLLAETHTHPQAGKILLLGVGININTERFTPELESIATSLQQATGKTWELPALAKLLKSTLFQSHQQFVSGTHRIEMQRLWQQYGRLNGQNITYEKDNQAYTGQVLGLLPNGALQVKSPEGEIKSIISGEVTLSKFMRTKGE